jgi:predicted kinase
VVLVGLPGSGKSTWVRSQGYTPISSDELRRWLADDITDQTIHRRVFAAVRFLLRQRVELRRPVSFIDATNLTPKERRPYIKIAQIYGCTVEAVFFDLPLDVCKDRNERRGRVVPADVIEAMAARLVAPSVAEGFDRVTILSPIDAEPRPMTRQEW